MPSVRLELTTFRLWDWRANQLRQEGSEHTMDCTELIFIFKLSYNDVKNQVLAIGDDFSKLQIQSVAATSKLENAIG